MGSDTLVLRKGLARLYPPLHDASFDGLIARLDVVIDGDVDRGAGPRDRDLPQPSETDGQNR